MRKRFACALACAALGVAGRSLALAQGSGAADGSFAEPGRFVFDWGLELKGHYRNSEQLRFESPFPFPPSFPPPGESKVFLETVDEGAHAELSTATLFLGVSRGALFAARLKVDGVDRYDRNPTSSDREIDVDELWLRFGRDPDELPARASVYAKLGKFAHFERQNDRHLESYGLIATAFNRFEDQGLELGAAFGRHVYVKVSATQGNPVFFRDPNALAGDNGTPELDPVAHPNPSPELKSGFPILYDAEVEDPDFDEPELGYGLGLRFGEPGSGRELNLLGWMYERDLLDTVDLNGTFYGGDIDLLNGPFDSASLPILGRRKEETGANLWLYLGGFSLFGQYVTQEIAGMDRDGYEVEAAWRIDLPLAAAVAGRQLFPSLQPAVRYSYLEPEFVGGGPFPAPSVRWEWVKLDYGIRCAIVEGLDVTLELAENEMTLANGSEISYDELLGTLRWRL
ncbi:MAG: hypothetical protein ACREQY_17105 [Candidatus Binatia bacterium]